MTIANNADDKTSTVVCDSTDCPNKAEYPYSALTAGGIRAFGWVPLGANKHRCPACAEKREPVA